ncbi:EF-hand domain-containing protein [Sphingomonas sp.]|uniref:EF-hand domain-containing protein n=1 Tax=Sphingomonas sp. TaxID=28214 RepID=UPI0025D9CE19|nr:EF-hand domain-containing protein [Sphingomonas sp.]
MITALALLAALQPPPQDIPNRTRMPISVDLRGQQQPTTAPTPIPLMIAEPVAMAIATFDSDQDGIVTRAEFDAAVRRSFELSAKGQPTLGYIAFGDWSERWLGNRNALPSPFEVDADGDNRITLTELQARFDLFFTRFDADKDGSLRRSELLTVRTLPTPGGRPEERDQRRQRDR